MAPSAVDLYLDLMSKTVSFSLWPEPPWPLALGNESRPPVRRAAVAAISKLFGMLGCELVRRRHVTRELRENGLVYGLYADTMIGLKRLANIRMGIETALREGIEGDFIETGAWRGGACIFMRAVLAAHSIVDRKVYVADSFEGLPRPDTTRFPADAGDEHHLNRFLAVSLDDVKHNFAKYGLLDDQVVFLEGFFADTLPTAPITKLALLRLDGDMYGSTLDALTHLYPKLQPGGFCIIDDYDLQGARQAVDDFRMSQGVSSSLRAIDQSSVFWRK
jgi:hypothetical protein